jgi:hypothetical protein
MRGTLSQRFNRIGWTVTDTGCWKWNGYKLPGGYGRISGNGGRRAPMLLAHRVSYSLVYGEIPTAALVLHSCDNASCVNPQHLRLGDQTQNMSDRRLRGRQKLSLTDNEVREIRDLALVWSRKKISEIYGVSAPHVSDIVNRKKRFYID